MELNLATTITESMEATGIQLHWKLFIYLGFQLFVYLGTELTIDFKMLAFIILNYF